MEYVFTSDDEINCWQSEEKSIDITGFIDSIDGVKQVRTSHGHVLKFTLNNGGTIRMKILIWGTGPAHKWEKEIKLWSVLEIRGGTVKLGNIGFRDPALHDMEYHVQLSSDIIILRRYNPAADNVTRTIKKKIIDLADVMFENGPVEFDCYIRTQPRTVQFYRTTCGQCQVTDGYYRLTINIVDYTPNEKLILGTPITIAGEFSHESSFFSISNMDDISIREGNAIMSSNDLRSGFHPIISSKRRCIDEPVKHVDQPVKLEQPVQHVQTIQSIHLAQSIHPAQTIQSVQQVEPVDSPAVQLADQPMIGKKRKKNCSLNK